jgi:hypothetical protein
MEGVLDVRMIRAALTTSPPIPANALGPSRVTRWIVAWSNVTHRKVLRLTRKRAGSGSTCATEPPGWQSSRRRREKAVARSSAAFGYLAVK